MAFESAHDESAGAKARIRALCGVANPRRLARPVCALPPIPIRAFASPGQIMNRLPRLKEKSRQAWPSGFGMAVSARIRLFRRKRPR